VALPLERWARQAVAREELLDFLPVADKRILSDIAVLKQLHLMTWQERQRRILGGWQPFAMPEGTYGGLLSYPPAQTITTTSINGSVNVYPNLTYSSWPMNGILAPQADRLAVVGKHTTGTTPANLSVNPLINSTGTWTTGGTAISGGSTMGVSSAVTGTASITNSFFYIIADLTIRSAGTSTVIVGMFHMSGTHPTAGPTTVPATFNLLFGGTSVTVDTQQTQQSVQIAGVHTTTTWTWNIEQLHWMDWN
jgi:hypothetical protein